jgi:subtilisin family serine protease
MNIAPIAWSLVALVPSLTEDAVRDPVKRSEIKGEMVVCFESQARQIDLAAVIASWNLKAVDADFAVTRSRSLLQWKRPRDEKFTHVIVIEYPADVAGAPLIAKLNSFAGVRWSAPNYRYTGDARELVPNDPMYGSQYHHPLMQNDLAWDITLGDPAVIIAVTDDGFERAHPDLADNIWVNTGEIAGDGIDNDSNGYVDDVNGWDFAHGNNNPDPDNGGDSHGTHVCGIAAARTNNGVGVAGTAGAATIMPVQFYDGTNPGLWTSTVIDAAFAYAVDNGARIITTSYSVDIWLGDPTVTAAFQYLYDSGVLHFNSAGNAAQLNPPRQAFHQTLLVANTNASDVKSSTSNYGTGIDLSAPGSSILSTVPGGSYASFSGTSMAAPNAAGAAALIWSANPGWTREQVAAQLVATCDNIDAQNPSFVGLLGAGRVNSLAALATSPLPPPRIVQANGLPDDGGIGGVPGNSFSIRFNQIMDPATVDDPGAFSMTFAGADATFGSGDDESLSLSSPAYMIGANEIVMNIVGPRLPNGWYRVVADAAVLANPFGSPLDGDGNGVGGDSWQTTFIVCGGPALANCATCGPDMNADIAFDGADIPAFTACALDGSAATPGCGCADLDANGVIDEADILLMVEILLDAPLPFFDDYPSAAFGAWRWVAVSGAEIDGAGIAEPSEPFAARFNGDPGGSDQIVSKVIDLSGFSAVRLAYYWQRTGGGESTDAGDDLFVEFLDEVFQWQVIHQHLGSGPDMTAFQLEDALLPAAARHEGFQLRIRCTASVGPFDDWFVDDVHLFEAVIPSADDQFVNTPRFVPVDITLEASDPNGDPLEYIITSLPANGVLTDPGAAAIVSVPYALADQGAVVNFAPSPPGFLGDDAFTFKVSDGENESNVATVDLTVGIAAPIREFMVDDLDPGWTTTGLWAFGQPTGGGAGNGDPTSGYSGLNVYGYNLNGNYQNNMPVERLTTTAIDCSTIVNAELRFRRWLGIASGLSDHASIEVSNDGANWVLVWEHIGPPVTDADWSLQTYDISAVADGQPTVFIRWNMGPTDAIQAQPGWNIDDVQIWGLAP